MNKQFKRLVVFDDVYGPPYWLGVDSGKKGGVTLLGSNGVPVSLEPHMSAWDVDQTWDNGACVELLASMDEIGRTICECGHLDSIVVVHEEPAGHVQNAWKTFAPVMMLLGFLQDKTIMDVISVQNSWWKARAGIGTHQKTKAAKASSIALAKLATGQDMGHDEADSYHMVKAVFNEYSLFKRLQTKKTS